VEEIIIDEEFRRLLPALDSMAKAQLEEQLLVHGCLNPLVLWNGILIDGYNRYEIIRRHDLPYRTVSLEFEAREDVIVWIIKTQVAQRNLTPLQLSHFRGLHYNMDKMRQGTSNQHIQKSEKYQNDTFQEPTAQRLANHYNVAPITIKRDSQISNAIMAIGEHSIEAKELVLAGRGNISRKRLQELSDADEPEIKYTIERILDGTHERRRSRQAADSEAEDLEGSADNLSSTTGAGNHFTEYEQLSLESFISRITDDFTAGIKKLDLGADTANSKPKLRLYIDMLEELYSRI